MRLNTDIAQRQQTRLRLSQTLGQAIGLLGLSNAELARTLGEAAADNPWLRLRLPAAPAGTEAEVAADGPSLLAHVLDRLPHLLPPDADRQIALALVEALDPAGYLPPAIVPDLAHRTGVPEAAVEAVLSALQTIEPRGLFARSLAECLALQMEEEEARPAMRRVLAALPHLTAGGIAAVAQASGLPEAQVEGALARLRTLNPRPAAGFACDRAPPRIADLVFTRRGARWEAALNPATLPAVSLRARLAGAAPGSRAGPDRAAATALVRAMERRNAALLGLGQLLAVAQAEFLSRGPVAQRRLTRRAVAAELGLHESSVSRLVAAASAETPMGTIPLRRFFSASGAQGAARPGALAVQERIRRIVAEESGGAPLSDAAIAESLAREGVALSRRSVARLRAAAGIATRGAR